MSRKRHNLYRIPIHLFFIILSCSFLIPLLMLLSISFTEEASIYEYGYRLFPRSLSTIAYEFVFRNPQQMVNAYGVTIYITLVGTFLSVLLMLMCAYSLSRKCFAYRKFVSGYLFFTMLFGGGLVPSYILTTQVLHLQDTLLVFILSGLVSAWNIFILRTLISNIPEAIIESAYIDGASEYRIFFSLVIPLSKPGIATIGLFCMVARWNEWMTALLYISKQELYPLQYLLQKILMNLETITNNMNSLPASVLNDFKVPSESVRMAMAVVAIGPMLLVIPFFQRYFVRGLVIGSVKG
ncbi:carbohydrate ABC transporter permease [Bianquea renquensis]|uniref:Carbohydrate ABC transporter permease n=1 Tax=Bianquea renquensis TaxID=2763661 RepID=A0A926DWT5_9FIRM|nr:carbohydrate ABC transporter permease [Bianquea renquensis]MBC8545077.1 carbohydrate ABC transporter permease [Bianquea renquensis]